MNKILVPGIFFIFYFGVGVICNSYHSSTEVAAYLANKAASVSVICRNEVPLEKTLGPKVGGYVKALHESKGVQFVINAEVTALTSKSGEGHSLTTWTQFPLFWPPT